MSHPGKRHRAEEPTESSSNSKVRIQLDHVGVATDGLDATLKKLASIFPSPPSIPESVPGEGVRLAFIDVGGTRMEVLESERPDSAVARFLARRAPGVHHLSFRVEGIDLDAWFHELASRGVRLVGSGPTDGSEGTRIFFVHPESTGGVLVEFSQLVGKSSG